jgi:hypothetical protein
MLSVGLDMPSNSNSPMDCTIDSAFIICLLIYHMVYDSFEIKNFTCYMYGVVVLTKDNLAN